MHELIEQINFKLEQHAVSTVLKQLGYHVISKGISAPGIPGAFTLH